MGMRWAALFLMGIGILGQLDAQEPKKETKPTTRYRIEPNVELYPQSTPKEALSSVLKAIDGNRITYLLAQLADPQWVDRRVAQVHGGNFDALVEETTQKLTHDRTSLKELRRFLSDGTWDVTDTTASAQLKDVKNRRVYLRKIGDRWYLESRQQPPTAEREK
jgi:HEAT repeat protein